ncbi:MAG: hypothetical protein ACFWTM_04040 [Mitsuokella multacida]|jgi:hypothetical protein
MTIYLMTCMLSMILCWFLNRFRRKGSNLQFIASVVLSALPCILVAGLRYGIGSDYFSYENYFASGIMTKDPLYYSVFNSLIQFFGGDFTASVFLVAAVFFLLTYARILEDSPYPWLSVFLLFGMTYFFASMNAMRQFLALAVLLYAIQSLEQKKTLRFFIVIAIASGIHLSSIIFAVLYFIHKIDLDTRLYAILTPVIFGVIYLFKNNLMALTVYLNSYENFVGDNSANGLSITMQFLWQIALVVTAVLVYKKYSAQGDQNKYRIYLETQLIALWEYALISVITPNEIMRIIWIFAYPTIIFTPMVIRRIPSALARIVAISIVLLGFSIFMYYVIPINNSHNTLPYQSIFDI